MKAWIQAARPRTLPLALATMILGCALGQFAHMPTVIALCLTATLLQITSNLANDYGDFTKGADQDRQGEARMVSSGAISAKTMKRAMYTTAALGFISGVIALLISPAGYWVKGILLVAGSVGVWAAIAYTVGEKAYGYRGLGDLFVFFYFGPIPILGAAALMTGEIQILDMLPAAAVGFLATAVLNVNNLRDAQSDKNHGKQTLVVKMGMDNAKKYHSFLVGFPFVLFSLYATATFSNAMGYLAALSLLMLVPTALKVLGSNDPTVLDGQLKFHALGTAIFGILLSVSLVYA